MRLSILVYGVLYVVLEMVGHALETVGWGRVTPLHVASALVDALLAIVMAIAVLVLWDVGRRRWGPSFRAWQARQLAAAADPASRSASSRGGRRPSRRRHPWPLPPRRGPAPTARPVAADGSARTRASCSNGPGSDGMTRPLREEGLRAGASHTRTWVTG